MRRALLLGNPGDGLTGVHADIAAMSALLARHAFTAISPLIGGTRAEILAAIRDLIKNSEPGDAAVLYYSGHGWRLEVPGDRRRDGGLGEFQGISPADVARTTAGDFRGILADELTALTDELTEKTANVTVILDCCHATNIVRGGATPRAGVRATPVPWKLTHAEFVASLRAQGLARPRRDPEVNPLAVRLLACRPHQQAGEDPRAPGGLLTRALAAVLAECDHGELVWEDVGRRVDAWVRSIRPSQHPIVVGPARRYMFSLDVRATTGTTACVTRDDVVWISGGALLDHRPGDRFVALSPIPDAPALARLEVTDVHHQLARATSTRPLPDGATVQQVGWASPRRRRRADDRHPATRSHRRGGRSPRPAASRSPRPKPRRSPRSAKPRAASRSATARASSSAAPPRSSRPAPCSRAWPRPRPCAASPASRTSGSGAPSTSRGRSWIRRAAARRRFDRPVDRPRLRGPCATAGSCRCSPPCSPPRPTDGSPC
jgi:hypothetical protein